MHRQAFTEWARLKRIVREHNNELWTSEQIAGVATLLLNVYVKPGYVDIVRNELTRSAVKD